MEIKHRTCGAVLQIPRIDDMEKLKKGKITCPVCKKTVPFAEFSIIEKENNEATNTDENSELTDNTIKETHNFILGKLTFEPPVLSPITLRVGNNIIGRKCNGSTADIQIPIANESKRTSRDHIKIEVKSIKGRGYVHCVSLCKERVNTTYFNNKPMQYGDCFVLKNGDILKLPDSTITFLLSDPNDTEYDEKK